MRKVILVAVVIAISLLVVPSVSSASTVKTIRNHITQLHSQVWNYQDDRAPRTWKYPGDRTRASKKYLRSTSVPYLLYVEKRWKKLALKEWKIRKINLNPYTAIHTAFGSEYANAVRISYCETGQRIGWLTAGVGKHDYWGTFQMGSGERSRYGYSQTALGQAVAAYRMWRVRGWRPAWECAYITGVR